MLDAGHILFNHSYINSQILSNTNHHVSGIDSVGDLQEARTDMSPAFMACMV